jgi:hypothetical protein
MLIRFDRRHSRLAVRVPRVFVVCFISARVGSRLGQSDDAGGSKVADRGQGGLLARKLHRHVGSPSQNNVREKAVGRDENAVTRPSDLALLHSKDAQERQFGL